MKQNIAIVGAGFSGAVIAHELAKAGHTVEVFDKRDHVGGNCHTVRDLDTQVMVHVYGPHIFHTSNKEVWNYINQFDELVPFINRVKAISKGKVYSLPINLLTINSFFGKDFSPIEAEQFVGSLGETTITNPSNFEEEALRIVGRDLYETFLKGYTQKQWGQHPKNLPASILKRLPIRFNYDDNYYSSRYQGIPRHGYTYIIERMLDYANIKLHLNASFSRDMQHGFDYVFYSGPIDAWFGFQEGYLSYRTLDFEVLRHDGDYQGNAVINYCDEVVPWTRITEHKHLAPWEKRDQSIIYREYSRESGTRDIPYYPVRLTNEILQLERYEELSKTEKNVSFVGRLGTYRYLDMHVTVEEALKEARGFLSRLE